MSDSSPPAADCTARARILVVGSAGHAKVVIDAVERAGRFEIAGLIDRWRRVGETTLGHAVLGSETDIPALAVAYGIRGAVIAIGDNFARLQVAAAIATLHPTIAFVSVVHPAAVIGRNVSIGDGAVVLAGAVVNPGASIGRHGLVNTRASLDHDSVMEDFASLGPGAVTGGHCRLGACTAVGIGACLAHRVEIGEHTVIGAGATVLAAIGAYQIAYGTPARPVRPRMAGDRYL